MHDSHSTIWDSHEYILMNTFSCIQRLLLFMVYVLQLALWLLSWNTGSLGHLGLLTQSHFWVLAANLLLVPKHHAVLSLRWRRKGHGTVQDTVRVAVPWRRFYRSHRPWGCELRWLHSPRWELLCIRKWASHAYFSIQFLAKTVCWFSWLVLVFYCKWYCILHVQCSDSSNIKGWDLILSACRGCWCT